MYKNKNFGRYVGHTDISFNPCFNGTMYKNQLRPKMKSFGMIVSILVLMELCIKTIILETKEIDEISFNPCFNGTMYKNIIIIFLTKICF